MVTQEKKPHYYKAKVEALQAEIDRLKAIKSSEVDAAIEFAIPEALSRLGMASAPTPGSNPFDCLPNLGKALLLNEWQRMDYTQPWIGSMALSQSRIEGPDRWSVIRNDTGFVLTHEKGYYGRDMATMNRREASSTLAGIIRYLRKADESTTEDPTELQNIAFNRMEEARLKEKIEAADAIIEAYRMTAYWFSLDLADGRVLDATP